MKNIFGPGPRHGKALSSAMDTMDILRCAKVGQCICIAGEHGESYWKRVDIKEETIESLLSEDLKLGFLEDEERKALEYAQRILGKFNSPEDEIEERRRLL